MVAFAVMLLGLAAGAAPPAKADVLRYGKRLDVHRIDARLGSQRFQAWAERTLGPSATLKWSADDCGEGGDDPPLCITAEALLRPHGTVVLSIAMGSVQGGPGGKPVLFFGSIEGLGPTELLEQEDLPVLASKLRAARALDAELSRLPDVAIDDEDWIRQVREMPATEIVHGPASEGSFGDWVAARAGARAKVEWFVEGCGPRGHHQQGPPVDLTGNKDEWASVYVAIEDAEADVGLRVRVGTCRKGIQGNPAASSAQLYDKRPGHIHIEHVSLDLLEVKLREIHAHR